MKEAWQAISRIPGQLLRGLLLAALFAYRYLVSPILHMLAPGGGCRFYPTCSEYAGEAVRTHGALRGTWLAFRRIIKCHPLGSHGYDPVPPRHGCSCTGNRDHQHPSPSGEGHGAAPSPAKLSKPVSNG